MESLKKFGRILRFHYEKILLSLVLLGLGFGVWYVYEASEEERQKIRDFPDTIERKGTAGVPEINLARQQALVQMAKNPPALNFSLPHNLVNPVLWRRSADGTMTPVRTGTEIGPDALVILNVTPLKFIIAFDRVAGSGYYINITNEYTTLQRERRIPQFVSLNNTNSKVFILREAKGPPENPTEFILELKETNERVSVTKEKPYSRVEGYQVDLKYPPEANKPFPNLRVGSSVRLSGEEYNIVYINQNEVVLSHRLNEKKFTVRKTAQR